MHLKDLCKDSHSIACSKGFWQEHRNNGELLMLIVTELAESLEALREGNPPSKNIKGFSSLEEEISDTLIRIADFCEGRNLRIEEAITAKIQFNRNRPKMHNKKF